MKSSIVTLSFITAAFLSANAQNAKPAHAKQVHLSNNGFYQNKGQITDQNYKPNPAVKYLLCSPDFNVQLRQTGFSYDTYTDSVADTDPPAGGRSVRGQEASHAELVSASVPSGQSVSNQLSSTNKALPIRPSRQMAGRDGQGFIRHYHRVDIELIGCNPDAQMLADGQSTTYYNYFTAGTPKGGVSYVHTYQKVTYKNIYPNIDLVFYASSAVAKKTPVEYNFIVHPGGKVSDIKLQFKGQNSINLKNNQLVINVNAGDFSESMPNSYIQDSKQPVAVNYRVIPFPPAGGQGKAGAVYGFSINHSTFNINHSTLIIDPAPNLAWGTYYGGVSAETGYGLAVDASNNVYNTGETYSISAIATAGAYQTTRNGGTDAFVAKFNPTGTTLLWGTYYGGPATDYGQGITIDASDNVYITGYTTSTSGVATAGAWQTTFGGSYDAFVAKFNSAGTSLLWSTYYGGTSGDQSYGIALDASDNVYISGRTTSISGIATAGAWQTTLGGSTDAFVAKFNSTGSTLLWGTYYGGTGNDYGYGLALDASDNVYITGYTSSAAAIATAGTYQTTWAGNYDAFVAKFNPTGASLLWGTYYGGSNADEGYGLALDASNNVYITGKTGGGAGMTTAGAWQTTYGGGSYDGFVAKFNPTGTSLLWGTYYGGTGDDEGWGIALDAGDNVYISGRTNSTASISTAGAWQIALVGSYDAFAAKFNPVGSSLLWGTYYGGASIDYSWYIALDASNNVYISGYTWSSYGIATVGAWQTTFGGAQDAFVAKFDSTGSCSLTALNTTFTKDTLCTGDSTTLSISAVGSATVKYLWAPGGLTTQTIHLTPAVSTTYTVTVSDTVGGCLKKDSITVTVKPIPVITLSGTTSVCTGDSTLITASGGTTYLWSNGATSSAVSFTPAATTTYTVTVSNGTCSKDTAVTLTVTSKPVPTISSAPPVCAGNTVSLTASGGTTYLWNTGETSSAISVIPPATTTYTVTVSNGSCSATDSTKVTIIPSPLATACCSTTISPGDNTPITVTPGAGYTYTWWPASGLSCTTCTSPVASPTVTTWYHVTVTDSAGCTVTDSVLITVKETCGAVYVPNAFSPNADGYNDVLYVYGNCIQTMQFRIYDRWGNKVFESDDVKTGWNGTFHGQPMNTGTYVYTLTVTDLNNNTTTKKGNITLVR